MALEYSTVDLIARQAADVKDASLRLLFHNSTRQVNPVGNRVVGQFAGAAWLRSELAPDCYQTTRLLASVWQPLPATMPGNTNNERKLTSHHATL